MPGRLGSARVRRRLVLLLAAALVAGAITGLIELIPSSSHRLDTPISNEPAQVVPQEKPAPPDPASRALARRFIETAVMRTDLDWAYDHVAADLKGRMTRAEWDKGTIPVIPYPAMNVSTTAFVVDYSFRTEVLYEVELVAKTGTGIRPMLFYVGLKRAGGRPSGRWLVTFWEPHYRPPVPYTS